MATVITRIMSGGQTGVDRGALDAAIASGIAHGGWCPRGRRAEDGVIPAHYALRETDSDEYEERTQQNVLDADGTLVLVNGPPRDGTLLACRTAERHGKPLLVVDCTPPVALAPIQSWLVANDVRVLNVAGPRESRHPGIGEQAEAVILALLAATPPDTDDHELTG
jgi:hypothetical protein